MITIYDRNAYVKFNISLLDLFLYVYVSSYGMEGYEFAYDDGKCRKTDFKILFSYNIL